MEFDGESIPHWRNAEYCRCGESECAAFADPSRSARLRFATCRRTRRDRRRRLFSGGLPVSSSRHGDGGANVIFSESNVHPEVRDDDFKRFLRFPPARAFEGPLAENAEWVRHWYARRGRPWCCAREVGIEVVPDAGLRLNGQLYGSPLVAGRFCDATSAIVVAASAGVEADEEAAARWAVDEPDRYFFVECYAAAVVEALLLKAGRRLAAWSQPRLLSRHYCPGYPG